MLPLWAACLLALVAVPAFAVPGRVVREPGWHSLSVWRQPQGLPQNTVVTLLQTQDGYLWIGTKGGVARFDGVRFTVFDDSDKSRLRENEVWALAEGEEGSVWIATYGGGVSVHRNGRFQILTTRDGLAHDYATALLNDHGVMWVGTDRGVSIYRDGTFTNLGVEQGLASNTVRSLFRDRDGTIWVGSDRGGLSIYKDGHFEIPSFEGPHPTAAVINLHRDGRGTMWISTSSGLYRLRDGRFTRYGRDDGLAADRVRRVLDGPKGSLWVVTASGLDRIPRPEDDTPRFESMVTMANLSWGLVDHEGSLWVGSLNGGLARLGQGHFTTYTPADGVLEEYVSTVLEDASENVWVGTVSGLMRYVDGAFASYGGGLKNRQIFSLANDRSGHLWVGTDRGLFRGDIGRCAPSNCHVEFKQVQAEGLPMFNARVILEDATGGMWLDLHEDGLVKYEDGRFTHYTTKEGLPSNFVRALAQDRQGALWVGTRGGGLARLEDGAFTTYSEKDGLVNDGIQALYLDTLGILWIATRQGVSRFENGRFHSYTAADGLFSNFVYAFVEDGRGSLWMTCSKGIFHVSRRELDAFAAGRARSITSTAYGIEHGLASTVAVVGHHPAAFRTTDGRLWFGTMGGLSIVDPDRLERNTLAPPVHIESVRVDGKRMEPSPTFKVGPGRGDLEIRYAGLSYLAPEKVLFQYRLAPYERDWVDAGNRRIAYYTNIPPGRYRFQVRGCNNDGVWNEAGDGFEINLAPYFYQTYWFYALCVGLVAAAGAATQRWRVERLRARERELSARVEEAVAHIKVLRGLLPICASCKKIRDDRGYWSQMETYIHEHSQAEFSHSICPDCMQRLYPEFLGPAPGVDGPS
jgi:ligand-binding sensor domain-containing protein